MDLQHFLYKLIKSSWLAGYGLNLQHISSNALSAIRSSFDSDVDLSTPKAVRFIGQSNVCCNVTIASIRAANLSASDELWAAKPSLADKRAYFSATAGLREQLKPITYGKKHTVSQTMRHMKLSTQLMSHGMNETHAPC